MAEKTSSHSASDSPVTIASSTSRHEEIDDSPLDDGDNDSHGLSPAEKRAHAAAAAAAARPDALSRTQSQRSARSRFSLRSSAPTASHAAADDLASIPDGGLTAWLQVLGSFFLFFNSWGIINSFGALQSYYSSTILAAHSPAEIAWIGSVQSVMLGFGSLIIGPLYDAGYFRVLIGLGSFLVVFGHMMLSLCASYWQIFLAQAICIGAGSGMLFVPSVAILSTYFSRHLATATGIATAGSSIGGTVYPIMVFKLIPLVGFGWTVRIIGFMSLATLLISNAVMRVRVLPSEKRKLLDLSAFTEPPYALFCIGGFCAFLGLYPVFVFISDFSRSDAVAATGDVPFYTLAMISAGSLLGRIVPNIIADRIGSMNMIIPGTVMSGVLALTLISVRTVGTLIAVCIFYGFFSGTLVSLPPTVVVSLSGHRRHMIGTRMGQAFFVIDISLLFGSPIGGWILGASSFMYIWVFSGVMLLLGGSLMLLSRTLKIKSLSLRVKV